MEKEKAWSILQDMREGRRRATESALGHFASGTCGLRCWVLIFQLGLVLFIPGILRVVSPVTHPVCRAATWVNDL